MGSGVITARYLASRTWTPKVPEFQLRRLRRPQRRREVELAFCAVDSAGPIAGDDFGFGRVEHGGNEANFVRLDDGCGFAGLDISEADAAVVAGGEDEAFVASPLECANGFVMVVENGEAFAGVDVPKADFSGAGDGAALVFEPKDAVHMVIVRVDDTEAAAGFEVPEPNSFVA